MKYKVWVYIIYSLSEYSFPKKSRNVNDDSESSSNIHNKTGNSLYNREIAFIKQKEQICENVEHKRYSTQRKKQCKYHERTLSLISSEID